MEPHAIGIDFGGTTIKSGLVRGGEIVARGALIDTQQCAGPDEIIDALCNVVAQLGEQGGNVIALGIGLPGIVDSVHGMVHNLTNVTGWDNIPLRQLLQERTALPTTIENDANSMTYGEWRYGAAMNARHAVCITLGTGVGGGLILDGRLYRGAQLGAGEIGHLSIDYRGIPGSYANYGALESYVGNSAIAERASQLYRAAGNPRTEEECTPRDLERYARTGDPIALGLWEALGTEIGAALASVVWVLNPDTIVIGGGVAKAGDLLFNPIRRIISERTVDVFHENLRVVSAALGNDAGIIGNAALAIDALAS